MGDGGHGFLPSAGFPADDCPSVFEFDYDDDLAIDFDTIYRILDEKPDSAEGSQENLSRVGSSTESGELETSHLLNGGSQETCWSHSRDSYSSKALLAGSGVPSCSFDDHVKVESGQGSSPAQTCSASLKDWFSLSQGGQFTETSGVSHSDMQGFTSCRPTTPYLNGVSEDGFGIGTTQNSFNMSALCHSSNSLSHGASNSAPSAKYCYNTTGASLSGASHSFSHNSAFRFFPYKEEATNDMRNIASESQSDTRIVFDRHGRLDGGSYDREPVLDLFSAREHSFKFEGNPLISPSCAKSYNSFDGHLAEMELRQPITYNASSGNQMNKVVHMTDKPVCNLTESENVIYSSIPGKDLVRHEGSTGGEARQFWSSVPNCSFQEDAKKEYTIMPSKTASHSNDIGNRSSSIFFDSNTSLQYEADLDSGTQSSEHFWIGDNEHIRPRSMDADHLKVSPESFQSASSQYEYFSDDDSDVCIIETNSLPVLPRQSHVMQKPVFSSQNSVVSQTLNHSRDLKLQPNKEQLIFQAALQDLSQPRSETSPPDGLLAVPLLRHQRIALSWMVQKETSSFPCSGGILADDQGLGKTISTIALILKEQRALTGACEEGSKREIFDLEGDSGEGPLSKLNGGIEESNQSQISHDDDKVGLQPLGKMKGRPAAGTLVVCPTSVLRQWADELRKKVTSQANLSVLVYYGPNRTKDPYELAKCDVVLTTYSIVSMEVPKQPLLEEEDEEEKGSSLDDCGNSSTEFCTIKKRKNPPGAKKKCSKQRKGVDYASLERLSGALAKVSWFRVVLDEAQSIKNRKTQVARACWGLRAKRRWCLSGTPIQNAIDDLYSYFRFLKYDPYSSYKLFCTTIKNPISRSPVKGYQKLQAVLKTIMLRRTKGTLLDGKPIISLPPKSIELRKVDFTKEERDFYSRLECDSRDQFREYAEAGTVKQNYVNILLMLLRLRQACDHPLLVKGYESSSTWKASAEVAKKLPREKQVFLLNCLEASQAICGICNDAPEDAVVSTCGHVFCKPCICEHLTGDDNQCPSANCIVRLTLASLFSKGTLNNALTEMNGMDAPLDCSTSGPVGIDQPCNENFPYGSSKIKAALAVLQSLAKPKNLSLANDSNQTSHNGEVQKLEKSSSVPDTPVKNEGNSLDGSIKIAGEKAIVFSQWTKMLDLLEAGLRSSCIQYRRLDGTMSVVARDKAVTDFNTLPEVSVMIMSLKAASLGLNMVAACHVLMLDLWWNPTTEDQAIDRAHRIGQTRPVTVVRFTVKDTVEDRILALQQKKRMMVASAFGEDEKGSRQSHLSVDDLKYLFMVDS
ncbi:PREDICTED: helicase-like transcription factor CHR28 isoform X2 [Tarenaya hassleriana]|uniref:helicase-like transcription factor CHR28 isoform X2 n=1 Tax=Tarenaya hassleriana TaxID=28532 RepID=UPI00053C3CC6|nr:PREDICTED: helicase-like transcription factor CHR28 isoform X2 [Tarenaya hassleriana]